ncbi:MAG: HK97 gp10 family phage protein [Rhodobacterales bacterium]|nr:HK97 gp10 family phage protein [Rhodobacterales bacterium]
MGIRITRGADLDIRLEKIAERSTRQLRRVHAEGSEKLAEVAAAMAPFKTGELEDSIMVIDTKERGNRIDRTVTVEAPHAIYMHEGFYNLGPGSQAKNDSSEHAVGRKFMERAAAWLIRDWKFYEKARAAVRKGLRG